MTSTGATSDTSQKIESLVAHYEEHRKTFERFGEALFRLTEEESLRAIIHSARWRTKSPESLRDKLHRKAEKAHAKGESLEILPENLFERINDLAGLRILHLHTSQFPRINEELLKLLGAEGIAVIEGPTARVWDSEYRAVFSAMGVETEDNERMYTSVHYVVSAQGGATRTAEIQVRTLAEEIWGEVDHLINYPHKSEKIYLTEQLRVLARVTSGCTRLVDSVFRCRDSE